MFILETLPLLGFSVSMPLFSVYLVGSQNSRSKGCKGQKRRFCLHFVLVSIMHATSNVDEKKLYPSHVRRHCQSTLPFPWPNLHQSFSVALLGTTYTRQCVNALQAGHEKPTSALWTERCTRFGKTVPNIYVFSLSLSLHYHQVISICKVQFQIWYAMGMNSIPLFLSRETMLIAEPFVPTKRQKQSNRKMAP